MTNEIAAFIRENVQGHTTTELAQMILQIFGVEISAKSIANFKSRNHLRSGLPRGGAYHRIFTPDMQAYIQQAGQVASSAGLARELREKFGAEVSAQQVRQYRWRNGLCLQSQISQTQRNNGKFQKQCVPANVLPIGSIVQKSDGYLYRKTENGWRQEHILRWESVHGSIPKDSVLIFKDKNLQNVEIENLMLVTREEALELMRHHLRFEHPAYTETGVLITKLRLLTRRKKL